MAAAKQPLLLLFFLGLLQLSEAYKILFVTPVAGRSHKNVFNALIYELADRQHDITVISPFKLPVEKNNIHDIVLVNKEMHNEEFLKKIFEFIGMPPVLLFFGFKPMVSSVCEQYLTEPKIIELIKAGKQFDLVIVSSFMNECPLATAPLLGKNIMVISPGGLFPWGRSYAPLPESFVPYLSFPYTDKMSVLQRMDNMLTTVVQRLLYRYYYLPSQQSLLNQLLPEAPTITEAEGEVSMALTNADPVVIAQRPGMATVVNVGGMHCKDPKKLPQDFDDFIQSSGEHGFIVFGLGSGAQSRFLPTEKKEALLSAFKRLKQKVIWKYEEALPNLPENVKITAWMPQQDLLGHSKCRLFISHGGLLSMQEAIYHGVPVVGIPLFGDQPANIANIKQLQIGDGIDYNNITEESIYGTVTRILSDKRYTENMKAYSAAFRDRYPSPKELASFWVEYVIRHDRAGPFDNPYNDMNFVQYFLLDIISFVLIITSVVCFALLKLKRKFCPCQMSVPSTKKVN